MRYSSSNSPPRPEGSAARTRSARRSRSRFHRVRWDNGIVQQHETQGEAFENGRLVAAVTVIEQARIVGTEMLVPGSNRIRHRQRLEHGPSLIVFEEIYDTIFRGKLARLAAVTASGDLAAKRAMRDAGERELHFQLALDDGGQITRGYTTWPEVGIGELETLTFPLFEG